MKILLISDEFPPFGGGAGYVGKQILDGLSSKKYEVHLLTNHKVKPYYKDQFNVFSIYRIPVIWVLMYFVKFLFLDWKKYDEVIVNDVNSIIPFCFYLPKRVRRKSMIIIHGTMQIDNYYYKTNIFFKLTGHLFEKLLIDVKYVLGVSNFMVNYIAEKYSGLTNLKVWNPGVDYGKFISGFDREKSSDERINILSVSRIVKGKGYLEMYEVFKRVIDKDEGYVWNIIGNGDYKEDLKKQINEDSMHNYIVIHEKVNREELATHYKKADVFFLLSNFEESLGLVYLEAQYFGVPCISNNKGGPKEIINSKTGFLVNTLYEAENIILNKKFKDLNSLQIHENSIMYDSKNTLNNLESFLLK